MPSREELEQAVKRKRLMKAVEAKREQDGMEAATKMADRGGDQEGIEATGFDKTRAALQGAQEGVSLGFSDTLKVPSDYLYDAVSGKEFGSTTDERRGTEADIQKKAPGYQMAGDIAASVAMPLGGVKKLGQGVIGGIEGAGRTEDLFSAQGAKDVATGAGLGFALGAGGELVGKGLEKAGRAIKKAPESIPSGAEIREGAMHKTPTQRRKEQQFPKEQIKNKEAVATGEKHGIFKGSSIDELVPKTQAKLQEIGNNLGRTAKESTAALGEMVQYTKKPALNSAQKTYDKLVASLEKKVAKGKLDTKEGARALAIYKEEFDRLASMIDESPNALEAIRELKTNIYSRMNSADFQFGGPKAGTPKDVLKDVTASLMEMEKESLKIVSKLLEMKGPQGTSAAKRLVSDHLDNLKEFGDLKKLETQLAGTVDKQVGNLGLKEIAAGSVGAVANPMLGAAAAAAQATKKKLETPKGQFFLAKIADAYQTDPAKAKTLVEGAAKILGVPPEAIGKALQKANLTPAVSAATNQGE